MRLEATVIKEKHPGGPLRPGRAECLQGLGNGVPVVRYWGKDKQLKVKLWAQLNSDLGGEVPNFIWNCLHKRLWFSYLLLNSVLFIVKFNSINFVDGGQRVSKMPSHMSCGSTHLPCCSQCRWFRRQRLKMIRMISQHQFFTTLPEIVECVRFVSHPKNSLPLCLGAWGNAASARFIR